MVQDETADAADRPRDPPGGRTPLARRRRVRPAWLRRRAPGGQERWEASIVRAIAVVTITGAVLTYLALTQSEEAVAQDRAAVHQTVLVQQQRIPAEIQVHAESGAAARYRRLIAEAETLDRRATALVGQGRQAEAGWLADDARMLRAVADNLTSMFDVSALRGGTAEDGFDSAARLQRILGYGQAAGAIPASLPTSTAAVADARHVQSQVTVGCVAALFAVLIVLTTARFSRRRWRPWLVGAAATGYLAATFVAVYNAARDVTPV